VDFSQTDINMFPEVMVMLSKMNNGTALQQAEPRQTQEEINPLHNLPRKLMYKKNLR
jgi:hypothetical protein